MNTYHARSGILLLFKIIDKEFHSSFINRVIRVSLKLLNLLKTSTHLKFNSELVFLSSLYKLIKQYVSYLREVLLA